jgi:arylsulfatase A-like enzyme
MKRVLTLTMLLFFLASCGLPAPVTNAPAPTASPTALSTMLPGEANTPTPTSSPTAASAVSPGKPNIILVLADDLDASAIQYMPKLKSLITDQGETFTNYFVTESLCCPSRATTLRGQYSHNTEIVGNALPLGGYRKFHQLGEESSTIATWLQDAGYRTLLAGKYMNFYPLKADPLYVPPGWSEFYSPVRGKAYDEYTYTLNENGQEVTYGHKPKDYGTDVYVGKAVDFIQRSARDGEPFFVYLAPYAPHAPYVPAPRHADLFAGLKAPRTPNYNEADVSDKPAYIRDRPPLTQTQQDSIDEDYRLRAQALQAIDEGIEAMVHTLQADGQLDNTYIFFTSDNGYHLGNHRQMVGKVSPYDEEMRVTMIVRGPGVPAGVTLDHLTGNVDLAPTFADLAGARAADFCDGRSLVPLMGTNPPGLDQWRQEFPFEYGADLVDEAGAKATPEPDIDTDLLEPLDRDELEAAALPAEKRAGIQVPAFRGIRLQTLSYVEYATGEVELYDLKADPYQLQNLASEAGKKLLTQLSARLQELAACKAEGCRTAEDAPFDLPAKFTQASTPGPSRFGVFAGTQASIELADSVSAAQQLGAAWVRTNADVGEADPDYTSYLAAGLNVVLTVRNRDASNIDTTYGTPEEWRSASFPYLTQATYKRQIHALLQPALSYLESGQQVWVQGGNEVFDASTAPKTLYWRGTMEQYLAEQEALYEAVKAVNPDIPVALAGFASATLDNLIDPTAPKHAHDVEHVTELLSGGKFDAVDLHFYGCVEDIPAKVQAVKELLPAGQTALWISTENGGPEAECRTTSSVSWSQKPEEFEQVQAQQVPARLAACADEGGSICLWFSLFDFKASADIFNHLGLLDQAAAPPRQKPGYDAFKAFIAQQAEPSPTNAPAIASISVCSHNGAGGAGSCPSGSFDTQQIVLAPHDSGSAIDTYGGLGATSDEHATIFAPGTLKNNRDYLFWVAAGTDASDRAIGVVVLSGGTGPDKNGQWTMDFAQVDGYGSYPSGDGPILLPAVGARCPAVSDGNPAHQDQTFDLSYAAPGSVVKDPTGGPGNLLMLYEGGNSCIGIARAVNPSNNAYLSLGIATSVDYGHTWPTYRGTSSFAFVELPLKGKSTGPNAGLGALAKSVCMGNDCTATPPATYGRYAVLGPQTTRASAMEAGKELGDIVGDGEPSAFVDDVSGSPAPYLYVVHGYKPGKMDPPLPNNRGSDLMIARAKLNGGTAPLSFLKWDGQAFAAPGLGGVGSPILPDGPYENCGDQSQARHQASISYVDDTQQYLLAFVCNSPTDPASGHGAGKITGSAWFYSTNYDLSDPGQWSPPQEIIGSWSEHDTSGGCLDYEGWYPTFMSLGNKPGHLSTDGYVFYMWGCQGGGAPGGRQYSSREFTITKSP